MDEKITLDRETFRALAVDTRIEILKILDDRQHTLTDLAEALNMSPSTIKEHLDKLVAAGLIKQVDKGMKWKYYKLTFKGSRIVNPHETPVWIILATSAIALFAVTYKFLLDLEKLIMQPIQGIVSDRVSYNLGYEKVASKEAVQEASQITIHSPQMPYADIVLILVLTLVLGICVGYLIKKKRLF